MDEMKKNKPKVYYFLLVLVAVNTLLYVFNIRIPFNNRWIEIIYGLVMIVLVLYILYLDRKSK